MSENHEKTDQSGGSGDIRVNGETIRSVDIAAEAQNHSVNGGNPEEAWHAAARALVVKALLLQEARRDGIEAEPQEIRAGLMETPEDALIRGWLEASLDVPPPDDEICLKYYQKHRHQFRSPTLYEPAHILLPAADGDEKARAVARVEAQSMLETIHERPETFERFVTEYSACPSRENGGRLGQIATGDTVKEFEHALDSLEPGEISREPVETRYGVHIVRLDAKEEGAILPFDAVKPRISSMMERQAWIIEARRLIRDLIAEAEVSGIDMADTGHAI